MAARARGHDDPAPPAAGPVEQRARDAGGSVGLVIFDCDVQAARAAGMRVLAFAGGLSGAGLLEGPHTIAFDDMRELPRLLDECNAETFE